MAASSIDKKRYIIKLLFSSTKGRIIACNILDALEIDLLDRKTVKDFFQKCCSFFELRKHDSLEKLIDLFQNVAAGKKGHPSFLFKCLPKKPVIKKNKKYCTVKFDYRFDNFDFLVRRLIDYKDGARNFGKRLIRNVGPGHPAWKVRNNDTEEYEGIFHLRKYDQIKSFVLQRLNRNLWITDYDELIEELKRSKYINKADTIRDMLGLIHIKEGDPLIIFIFSGETLKDRRYARPTFLEAGNNSRFRTIPDSKSRKKQKEKGWTVDLFKFADNKDNIDGMMELYLEMIDIKEFNEIEIWIPGRVSNTRGQKSSDDDRAFYNRIRALRKKKKLQRGLLDLLC